MNRGFQFGGLCGVALLSACATTPPPATSSAATCNATPAQASIGQTATQATGAELFHLTGARTLRWIAPGTAVTMDFRPDRLSVSYDEKMTITRISCS